MSAASLRSLERRVAALEVAYLDGGRLLAKLDQSFEALQRAASDEVAAVAHTRLLVGQLQELFSSCEAADAEAATD